MDQLLARCKARLSDVGIAARVGAMLPTRTHVHSATVQLSRDSANQEYALIYGPVVRLADVDRAHTVGLPTLIFSTYVAPKTAEAFRRANVQYLDMAGNAWIEFGEILIDVRGRPRPADTDVPSSRAAGNLFSAGRAQVVFVLLAWTHLWDAPRREIATAAGVSLGLAHDALALLAEAGYGRDYASNGHTDLLDLWAAAFPTGLARRHTLSTYRGDIDTVEKVNADDPVFVSGEWAASEWLQPATLTLYVPELDPRLPIVNKWRSDGPTNILVRRKFWRAPDQSDHSPGGVPHAPWPLVYADLVTSDDPRIRSVAKQWRNDFAGSSQSSHRHPQPSHTGR